MKSEIPEDNEKFWEQLLIELGRNLDKDNIVFVDEYDTKQPHELVIGVMTQELKLISYMHIQAEKEYRRTSFTDRSQSENQSEFFDWKRKVLDAIFWRMAERIYPELTDANTYQSVGLRKGFIIVAIKTSFSALNN